MKKITSMLTAMLLAGSLAACGASSSDSKNESKEKAPVSASTSSSSDQAAAAKKASAKDAPSYKGKTLYEAVTDLRKRKIAYQPKGKDFNFKDEVKKTREWMVTGQKAVDNGSTLELTVEPKKK